MLERKQFKIVGKEQDELGWHVGGGECSVKKGTVMLAQQIAVYQP